MTQTCQQCHSIFEIDQIDQDFYKKMVVPPPTFCWRCRMQRRFAWRNERKLYSSVCSKTGRPIITAFNPESHLVVYDRDIWWKDDWSALDFGQDYDWSTPFFLQFQKLLQRVPQPAVFNNKCTNSAYCNHVGDMNNCYLVFATWTADNVSYSHQVVQGRDSFDVSASSQCELAYYTIGGDHLYNTQFVQDCAQVQDSMLLFDCKNVHDCFGCTNLRNKSFCFLNEQFDEKTYREKVAAADTGSYKNLQALRQQFAELKQQAIHRFAHTVNVTEATGENLVGVNNSQYVFDAKTEVTDCRYLVNALQIADSRDGYGVGAHGEQLYEGVDFGVDGSHMAFGVVVWGGRDNYYCYNCTNCTDCFGCVGLRGAKYCIFNKQYSKAEYEELLPKVITHMNAQPYVDSQGLTYRYGEFFPVELSPFAYNETVAQEHFPLTESEAQQQGWKWQNSIVSGKNFTITASQLPDHIKGTPDSITKESIQCDHQGNCAEQCTQVYKILPAELQYLKKRNLALPRLCSNCRHFDRLQQKLPFNLWSDKCSQCAAPFMTAYRPGHSEKIYCAKCYQAAVE